MGLFDTLKGAANHAKINTPYKSKCPSCGKYAKFIPTQDKSSNVGKFECQKCGHVVVT